MNIFKYLLSLILLVSVSGYTYAQESEEAEEAVEEVVITGSRIKRKSINSASVVTTITRDEIDESQALLTADVLRLSTYNTLDHLIQLLVLVLSQTQQSTLEVLDHQEL